MGIGVCVVLENKVRPEMCQSCAKGEKMTKLQRYQQYSARLFTSRRVRAMILTGGAQ